MNIFEKGLLGERRAERVLRASGCRVLDRRYRACGGEIDLIIDDGGVLAFVEVKYRARGDRGDGLAAVGSDKRRRLVRAAKCYLKRYDAIPPCRFDVLEITSDGAQWVKNAFTA